MKKKYREHNKFRAKSIPSYLCLGLWLTFYNRRDRLDHNRIV